MLSLLAGGSWYILFSFIIFRMVRTEKHALTLKEVFLTYGFKIIAGCVYGYIFLNYYDGDDTWLLHFNSLDEKQLLLNDPYRFFWEFTPGTAIRNGTGLIQTVRFYLNDLEYALQAKTLALINLITQGNYYINCVFWNFILFWGHYWLFKLLVDCFPQQRGLYFLLIFFFPPTVFWLSGIRADGLLFLSSTLFILSIYRWMQTRKLKSLILSGIGFIGVSIFRPAVAALLIPAIISFWLTSKWKKAPAYSFLIVYFISAVLFFTSSHVSKINLPQLVVDRQQDFKKLTGTSLPLDTLEPRFGSFAALTPQAVTNTFIRPFLWEAKGILQLSAAIEILVFWGIVLLVFLNRDAGWKTIITQPINLLLLVFGISLYLFIGYTIPFPGAIVRYKTIPELLILAAIISMQKQNDLKH